VEGQFWLDECLRLHADRPPSPPRAKAQIGAALHAWLRGDSIKAKDCLDESLAYFESIADQQGQVEALCGLAVIHLTLGDVDGSQQIAQACIELSQMVGNSWTAARTCHTLGVIQLERGNPAAARLAFEDEACQARETGDPMGLAMALASLGDVARITMDDDRAASLYEEALGLMQGVGVMWWIPDLLHNLGYVALRRGDLERARQLFADGLDRFRNVGDRRGAALCFIGLGGVAQATGAPTEAARLLGAARWLLSMTDTPLWAPNAAELERIEHATIADLGPDAFAAASREDSVLHLAQFRVDPSGMFPARPAGLIAEAERSGAEANPLSQREREVATLVGRGLTNREIGGTLFVAERTVEAHVTHILNKLDLRSRAQIAVWAAEHGLLATARDE
jgi:DNA-binding CsgD family transcriptional regulator/tetratricopeptide (TPR) repeat protein